MTKNIYARNFAQLLQLVLNLEEIGEPIRLSAPGFPDLHVEILARREKHFDVALSHYYEQNGDLVPDPDVAVRVYTKAQIAEALTHHDTCGYRLVYAEDGKMDLRAKEEINDFLDHWLRKLLRQGYKVTEPMPQGAATYA